MPLGDSITSADQVPGGYRIQLAKRLEKAAVSFDFVGTQNNSSNGLADGDHEGHNGFWTQNLESGNATVGNVSTWVESCKPDVVLLMSGTNNLLNDGKPTAEPTAKSLAATQALVNAIIAAKPSTAVIVSSVPPLVGKENARQAFNAGLPDVVRKLQNQGKHVRFVDAGSTIHKSDFADDGIHPDSLEAYNRMGNAWFNALKSAY